MGKVQKNNLVIGAGMVGVCCALYLQRAGHQVTLIDQHEPGSQTSFGNAATFASYACIPVNHPKLIHNLPKLMLGADRPLSVSPLYLARRLPWMLSFLRHCRRDNVDHTIRGLGALLRHAEEASIALFQSSQVMDLIKRQGTLYLYATENSLSAAQGDIKRRRDQGVPITEITSREIQELEPHLAPTFSGGILFNDGFQLINPKALIQRLTQSFIDDGGQFIRNKVCSLKNMSNGRLKIGTDTNDLEAKRVIIAAGAWSTQISGGCIDPVPLDTERGYHVMFPNDAWLLNRPVGLADAGLYISPLDNGLRAAGTVELAGLNARPNQGRLNYIESVVRRVLPEASARGSDWLGFRPTMPDSLPVIGQSSRHSSVFYAFGHHHIGITLGGITGKLIQQLIDREPTTIDLAPYSPNRF